MPIQLREHLPQGLKPALLAVLIGRAEEVAEKLSAFSRNL